MRAHAKRRAYARVCVDAAIASGRSIMSEAGEPVLSAPAVPEKSDILVDDAAAPEREDDENSLRNESSAATRQSSVDTASAADEKKPGRDHGSAAAPDTVKAADGSQSSKQLAGSSKLEDQINLQHLVELMKIFYVSQ